MINHLINFGWMFFYLTRINVFHNFNKIISKSRSQNFQIGNSKVTSYNFK
jgi:hypothetical protein